MSTPYAYYKYLNFNNAYLFTVVCLPEKVGKFPTIILRTPYVDADELSFEQNICDGKLVEYSSWIENGYAVIFQHCRGRGKSSGDCIPYINEREDGLFLQAWLRKQPFYNGELYLWGGSYTSSVHFVTHPFADDIKGAVLQVQDSERYNCNYRNGFYKIGLHGDWYVDMYKRKTMPTKNYTSNSFKMLPLSDFSTKVFGEKVDDFDEILKHPDRDDEFWNTRFGGGEGRDAVTKANIPVLLVTGFYDIYTGGVFDMWNSLDDETKSKSSLAVHPFDHGCIGETQPICFENGNVNEYFKEFSLKWFDSIREKCESPFEKGKVTYYKLFENKWFCDDFKTPEKVQRMTFGKGLRSYVYNPEEPATFKGGLSTNFGGNAWQEIQNRQDVLTFYTEEFVEDTYVKGKISAKLTVKSDCEDTCFYVRLSLCKNEGDYGLRDDINQISNFNKEYVPNSEIEIDFSFDEHAFLIKKGEKIRIDISSSAHPFYVRHTNNKGLFSEQKTVKTANNTVNLEDSYLEIPVE